MSNKYKRILVKISGEQLAGKSGRGIDTDFINWLAEEIKPIMESGTQVAVVPGAGNWIRGADFAGNGIERSTADYMGMLGGVINGQAIMDIFQSNGLETRVMSSIRMEQICEPYVRRKAIRHMDKGRVLVISGGTGRPYVTHDTAGVSYGLELDCEVVIKASNVDGVFDKDPHKHNDAVKYDTLDYQSVMENPHIKVMDKSALGLAMDQDMDVLVFNIAEKGALLRIAKGEAIGTLVS